MDEWVSWGIGERQWSASTAAQYARRVSAADAWMRREGLIGAPRGRPEHYRAWWDTLPATPASREQGRKALTAYGDWLVATGRRATNPAADLPRWKAKRGRPRPIGDESVRRILADATRSLTVEGTAAASMLWTGMRVSECVSREWADARDGWLRIEGKGGHTRYVPVPADLARLWLRWRASQPPTPWMLPSPLGGHRAPGGIRDRIRSRYGVTPHQLRHTFATRLLASCGDLRIVQEALGHASPATTAAYAAVSDDRMVAAVGAMWAS